MGRKRLGASQGCGSVAFGLLGIPMVVFKNRQTEAMASQEYVSRVGEVGCKRQADHRRYPGTCDAGLTTLHWRKRSSAAVSKWNMRESAIFAFFMR